ncbi:MAG: hypothetical protein AAGA93_03735 [Actinomycetota bacterium]
MNQRRPDSGFRTGFDVLDPPADLGTARARLRSLAVEGARGGAVLHLGGGIDPVTDSAVTGSGDAGPGAVVADTVLWRTGRADLRRLAASLTPERPLYFLEPAAELGWRRLVHRIGRPGWRRLAGHHFEFDVPVELRVVGLVVTDLVRFGVGPAGVRSYAMGRAEPLATLGGGGD